MCKCVCTVEMLSGLPDTHTHTHTVVVSLTTETETVATVRGQESVIPHFLTQKPSTEE